MDIKIKETIYKEIHNKGEIEQAHIVELLKIYDDKPNVNKLVESYYKSKANRIISSFKDDNHVRDCFAVKERKENHICKYINYKQSILRKRCCWFAKKAN